MTQLYAPHIGTGTFMQPAARYSGPPTARSVYEGDGNMEAQYITEQMWHEEQQQEQQFRQQQHEQQVRVQQQQQHQLQQQQQLPQPPPPAPPPQRTAAACSPATTAATTATHTQAPRRSSGTDNPSRRSCEECGTSTSPQWRVGPSGPNTLCNACGLRFTRMSAGAHGSGGKRGGSRGGTKKRASSGAAGADGKRGSNGTRGGNSGPSKRRSVTIPSPTSPADEEALFLQEEQLLLPNPQQQQLYELPHPEQQLPKLPHPEHLSQNLHQQQAGWAVETGFAPLASETPASGMWSASAVAASAPPKAPLLQPPQPPPQPQPSQHLSRQQQNQHYHQQYHQQLHQQHYQQQQQQLQQQQQQQQQQYQHQQQQQQQFHQQHLLPDLDTGRGASAPTSAQSYVPSLKASAAGAAAATITLASDAYGRYPGAPGPSRAPSALTVQVQGLGTNAQEDANAIAAMESANVPSMLPAPWEVKPDEWLEELCCQVCKGADNEADLMLCDGCNGGYHASCMRLPSIPEGDWLCPSCTQQLYLTRQQGLPPGPASRGLPLLGRDGGVPTGRGDDMYHNWGNDLEGIEEPGASGLESDDEGRSRRRHMWQLQQQQQQQQVLGGEGTVDCQCELCGTKNSPQWRAGRTGPNSLCNTCGLRLAKLQRPGGGGKCRPSFGPKRSTSGTGSGQGTGQRPEDAKAAALGQQAEAPPGSHFGRIFPTVFPPTADSPADADSASDAVLVVQPNDKAAAAGPPSDQLCGTTPFAALAGTALSPEEAVSKNEGLQQRSGAAGEQADADAQRQEMRSDELLYLPLVGERGPSQHLHDASQHAQQQGTAHPAGAARCASIDSWVAQPGGSGALKQVKPSPPLYMTNLHQLQQHHEINGPAEWRKGLFCEPLPQAVRADSDSGPGGAVAGAAVPSAPASSNSGPPKRAQAQPEQLSNKLHTPFKVAMNCLKMDRFVVRRSCIAQAGIFTRAALQPGELLMEYAGEVVRQPVADLREQLYKVTGKSNYLFALGGDLVVDATLEANMARFINHSCMPNCESKHVVVEGQRRIFIYAGRHIAAGEELTYDYKINGGLLCDPDHPQELCFDKVEAAATEMGLMPCKCGTPSCRRFL